MIFQRAISCAALLVLLLLAGNQLHAQILTYTNDSSGALNAVATDATGTALTRVNGASRPGTPCNTGYSVTNFSNASAFATTLAGVETSVTPLTGYTLNVTGFSVDLRRSASGPANIRLAYSTNGGTTWTDQGTNLSPNNAGCGTTATGTWTTSFSVPAPGQLKFRVYGFGATSTSGNLQVLNLVINGTISGSTPGCSVPAGLSATGITTTSATLNWSAATGATSYHIQYRKIGTTTWSSTTSATTSTGISGLTAATSYEFQVETVCAAGTSGYSGSTVFTTSTGTTSLSSGKIAIYFNTPVNNTVSSGVNAIYLASHMADTLVAYISRAKYSIDIAQYDYNQSSGYANIANAVNAAALAGKKVRWIYDGSQSNTGIALLNSSVHTLASPTTSAYGIMHDKFVIIDANSTNPNDAILSTGSEDWGVTQFNSAHNNILFIQDSALAHAYQNQFNMMWGDTGITPNSSLSKFGPYKTDLGAHTFTIGGKTVELYFSPADHTDSHIESTINSANTDLYFGVYAFTRSNDANAIVARQTAGVYTAGIVDQYSNTGSAYPILTAALGANLKTYSNASIVYHNKMLIVDPSNNCSDPLVLTGSHNWTTAADTKNDENILIIHDDTIANIYYQAFYGNFTSLSGTLTSIPNCTVATCGSTTALAATSVTTASAVLNWIAVPGAINYSVQYRQVGTTTWSSTTSTTNSVTVSGLLPATSYEYQVQTICSGGSSAYCSSISFTTLALPCSVPTGLSASGTASSSATLTWIAVSGAVSYNIQYRQVGTIPWSSTTSTVNSVTISGLLPVANYEFQVEVVCSSSTSGYSTSGTFTTTSVSCDVPVGLAATSITTTSAIFHWSVVSAAANYRIRYRDTGAFSTWNYLTTTNTYVPVGSLLPATVYEFQVQALCSASDSSGYGSSFIFSTLNPASVLQTGISAENNFRVFPNPAKGNVTVYYHLSNADKVSVALYNMVGQEVMTLADNQLQQPGDHD